MALSLPGCETLPPDLPILEIQMHCKIGFTIVAGGSVILLYSLIHDPFQSSYFPNENNSKPSRDVDQKDYIPTCRYVASSICRLRLHSSATFPLASFSRLHLHAFCYILIFVKSYSSFPLVPCLYFHLSIVITCTPSRYVTLLSLLPSPLINLHFLLAALSCSCCPCPVTCYHSSAHPPALCPALLSIVLFCHCPRSLWSTPISNFVLLVI